MCARVLCTASSGTIFTPHSEQSMEVTFILEVEYSREIFLRKHRNFAQSSGTESSGTAYKLQDPTLEAENSKGYRSKLKCI